MGSKEMPGDGLQRLWARWVDAALRDGRKDGFTNKGLAARLGIDPTQVTRMRSGERAIKAHELPVIEQYLGQVAPSLPGQDQGQRVRPLQTQTLISVEAIIAPGAWREAGAMMLSAEKTAALPDHDLVGMRQYLCGVEGDPRRHVICVPYKDKRVHPQVDDLVHVVRFRGDLEEHTLWLTQSLADGSIVLVPETGGGQPIRFPISETGIELRGLVVADILRRSSR